MRNKIFFIMPIIILLTLSSCANANIKGNPIELNEDYTMQKNDILNDNRLQQIDNNQIIENRNEPGRDDPIEINECQVIDEEGEYFLNEDINTDEQVCIDIQINNVVLDCQNHIIEGNSGDEISIGIRASGDDLRDLTIKNCRINEFEKGIYFENVVNSKIMKNTITNTKDSYKLEHPDNKFNLNDTTYDMDRVLSEEQLPSLLKNSIFLDNVGENRNEIGYTQELLFTNRGGNNGEKTLWYIYDQDTEDGDRPMGDYLYLSKSRDVWVWTYKFDLNNAIPVANSADLEGTELNILGINFVISDVELTGGRVSELNLLAGDNEIVLQNDREARINNNNIIGSKVDFVGENGFDQFMISFKPRNKIFLKPGESYIDPLFGAFKLLFRKVNEDNPEEIIISAVDEKVDLTVTNKDGDTTTWAIAFVHNGKIIPGKELDEPFIALEGDWVTNTSMGESELSGMTGIRFLFSKDNISHIIKIKEINTLSNKTTFYDETTDTEYTDQEFTPETDTTFSFLPDEFRLNFSFRHGLNNNTQITFSDINDKGSTYFLKNGGNITFYSNWSGSSTPGGMMGNGDIPGQPGSAPYYLTFGEADSERETNIPLNVIGINLTYSSVNHEINLQSVYANNKFVHGYNALKQKDKSDTTLKAGKTVYGTYVEQVTPTGAGTTDSVTIKTPDTATYAEVLILEDFSPFTEREAKGIEILNSNNNLIADNIIKNNYEGVNLVSSNSNNLVSNAICYNKKDIKIEGNNELLYNQFDSIEGFELEGMPCDVEEQEIQLNEGWNLISSYLVSYFTDIDAIFGSLARDNKLLMVKNEHGRFYRPANNFNNIPEWNSQKAYQVEVSEPVNLIIKGQEHINPRIQLHQGWNYIAYPLTEEREMNDIINNVLANLIRENVLEIIKDTHGRFFKPSNNFNNLPRMSPGQGYMIKVTRDTVIDFGE